MGLSLWLFALHAAVSAGPLICAAIDGDSKLHQVEDHLFLCSVQTNRQTCGGCSASKGFGYVMLVPSVVSAVVWLGFVGCPANTVPSGAP